MRKIDAFEEYGVRWTYHVPKKAFRRVENLHGACMKKKKKKKKKKKVEWCVNELGFVYIGVWK